jgi:dienelactone hydrolase
MNACILVKRKSLNTYTVEGYGDRLMPVNLYQANESTKQPIVVYAHGINGFKDWGGMPTIADLFAKKGLNFLSFNFSHNGTTVDEPTEFVDLEAYAADTYLKRQHDLNAIISWLKQHLKDMVDITRIYLIGHSRGGTDSILFASKNVDIVKLISWAAPSEAKTPWRNWPSEKLGEWKEKGVTHLKNGRTGQMMPISYALMQEFKANKHLLDVENAARALERKPWLIVHGEEDEAVFVKDAYSLKSWQAHASVHIIPDAGHTFDRKHPESNDTALPKASLKLVEHSINFLLSD